MKILPLKSVQPQLISREFPANKRQAQSRRRGMTRMEPNDSRFSEFRGQVVVLDVASPYIYLGTLAGWDTLYFHLVDADVHDIRDTNTTRELYLVDARRLGINANRKLVLVRRDDVVSLSRLDDVLC